MDKYRIKIGKEFYYPQKRFLIFFWKRFIERVSRGHLPYTIYVRRSSIKEAINYLKNYDREERHQKEKKSNGIFRVTQRHIDQN